MSGIINKKPGTKFIMLQQQRPSGKTDDKNAMKQVVFQVAGESHQGLCRRKNEDNYCVIYSRNRHCIFAVVADGIGGHSRGEVASYICCRELADVFLKQEKKILTPADAQDFLKKELEKINLSIYLRNRANRNMGRPMGTTVNSVLFLEDFAVMANAGDSRLYQLLPGREAEQLSTDHSFKAALASSLEADKFRSMENVIYRAVGLHRNFEFDLRTFPVVPGGKYLLCTDGMYRSLSLEKLRDTLKDSADPRCALDIFMRSALVSGGKDNITGIAVFAQGENNE